LLVDGSDPAHIKAAREGLQRKGAGAKVWVLLSTDLPGDELSRLGVDDAGYSHGFGRQDGTKYPQLSAVWETLADIRSITEGVAWPQPLIDKLQTCLRTWWPMIDQESRSALAPVEGELVAVVITRNQTGPADEFVTEWDGSPAGPGWKVLGERLVVVHGVEQREPDDTNATFVKRIKDALATLPVARSGAQVAGKKVFKIILLAHRNHDAAKSLKNELRDASLDFVGARQYGSGFTGSCRLGARDSLRFYCGKNTGPSTKALLDAATPWLEPPSVIVHEIIAIFAPIALDLERLKNAKAIESIRTEVGKEAKANVREQAANPVDRAHGLLYQDGTGLCAVARARKLAQWSPIESFFPRSTGCETDGFRRIRKGLQLDTDMGQMKYVESLEIRREFAKAFLPWFANFGRALDRLVVEYESQQAGARS
jgi:hypothetical protein